MAIEPAPLIHDRRQKVGLRTKLGYATGAIEETTVTAAAAVTMVYYNQVLGVSPALCGAALLIAALVDAFADPLVGALSDGLRTRWGRRHPLMLLAAAPIGLAFYLLYQPPRGLSEHALFLWLACTSVALGVSKSFYAIPHTALGAELTDDYNDRTSIYGWSSILGALAGMAMGYFIFAVLFPTTRGLDNGLLNAPRYELLAIIGMVVCTGAVLLTADQIPRLHAQSTLAERLRRGYSATLRETWDNLRSLAMNPSYLSVCICWFILSVSGGVIGVVGSYGTLYGLGFSTEKLALLRLVGIPAMLLCIPISMFLTRRLDKKYTVILMIVVTCLLIGLPYTLKLTHLFPANGSPLSFPLYFVMMSVAYIGLPIVPIVINSQMVDIADEHELNTGNRAEGLIFSVRLFSIKATTGLGGVLGGVGLQLIHFPKHATAATLAPGVVDGLMFMLGPLYYIIVFGGLGFALLYRLDRVRHEEILKALEVRRVSQSTP